jgi:glyoxylase-like metal-dependent hydrolase (beta-lactamase superfamily II)
MLQLKKITDSIYRLESRFEFFLVNNYLLMGDKLTVLIDTGFIATNKEIIRFFKANDLNIQDIDVIFNTHCHLDHSSKNYFFKTRTNAKLMIHEADRPAIESLKGKKDQVGSFAYDHEDLWMERLNWWNYEADCKADGSIIDEIFDLGNCELKVIHTPGHTLGHCSFLLDDQFLFAGDMGFESLWYGNARASLTDYINSFKRIMDLKPKMILSGHLNPIKKDIMKRYERRLSKLQERDERILNLIENGVNTLEKLVNLHPTFRMNVSNRADKLWQDFGEKNQVLQHLNKLKEENKIKEVHNNNEQVKWEII